MTKREAIQMYFSDIPGGIEEKFIDRMIKTMSNDSLISEFNRKSKGSKMKISRYISGYIEVFELDFFELTENEILKINTSPKNLHYHNDKNMSREEMRYRIFHNIDC
jgi:hypothetical protein